MDSKLQPYGPEAIYGRPYLKFRQNSDYAVSCRAVATQTLLIDSKAASISIYTGGTTSP